MERNLLQVYRAMPLSCLILLPDERFTIVEASDAYLRDTLTRREAIVGRGLFEVFPDNPAVPESQSGTRVRASLAKVIATRAAQAMRIQRYDVPLANGGFEKRFWLTTNSPVMGEDGKVGYLIHRVQDITKMSQITDRGFPPQEREIGKRRLDDCLLSYASDLHHVHELMAEEERRWQAAEAQAKEADEKLALAVDAADLGTFYCPMPLGIISWNAVCKAHFFLPEDAEVDLGMFYGLIHPDDRDRTRAAIEEAVFHGKLYEVEYRTVADDGRVRWVRAKGRAYYDIHGVASRFDGITIDITRQKNVEEERLRTDRQKDEFLAMLAHELRNPLAPIRAAAQIMMLGPMDVHRTKKTSEIINRQVIHMTALIDDLLDVSRVTRGLVLLDKEVVSTQEILSDALEQTRPLILSKGHQLRLSMVANDITVFGDKKRLVQVVANLLNNAAKYTPEGGHLVLELSQQGADAVIRVMDDGMGIENTLSPHVFDLFTQAQRTPDRRQGGLGIGLALVRSLVDLHQGEVSCESDGPEKGTTFTVRLPIHHAAGNAFAENRQESLALTSSCLEVLVVDDNEDAAMMLAFAVETAGHHVSIEHDAQCALTSIHQASDTPVDVCLLDIGLPDIDGNEVARRLRAAPSTSDIALIAVTGYGQPQDLDAAREAGFDRCLVKPVDIMQLTDLLALISEQKALGGPLRKGLLH